MPLGESATQITVHRRSLLPRASPTPRAIAAVAEVSAMDGIRLAATLTVPVQPCSSRGRDSRKGQLSGLHRRGKGKQVEFEDAPAQGSSRGKPKEEVQAGKDRTTPLRT